ncbi:MAG: class I SAM-dependent methyltransferase [Gemmatimonadaceae bacterium]
MSEWFTRWFGKEYLDFYPLRDEREARSVVRMIRNTIPLRAEGRALDLACGAGRYTRALCGHIWTVGLDLSMELLEVAIAESPHIPYVRADMRSLPIGDSSFDLVVNLFTSFGYFSTDDQNRAVLTEVRRVLAHDGVFVLDYLNAIHVRSAMVRHDSRRIGHRDVTQDRWITPDGRYVQKRITATGLGRSFVERVRMFEPDDLRCMLHDSGFVIEHEFGDYASGPLDATNPRAIFFAHRG